ncbi:MAG: alpha/beta hydrolase [Bacillota bacterium]|nr:alpha/beta hydrolase [Bacillota bacterium]MDW7683578.1 alpha/beta hydrolase [Bacillota bacterium]
MGWKKIIGIIILVICGIAAIFIGASTLNHNYRLRKEAKKYPPPGKLVEVNNQKIHVFSEGEGNITLVFMSGHGTPSPVIDFKPLWQRLSNEYRITVIEKPGYGWSEASDRPRDLATMLEETREALSLSGENGPYVLVPHSMSGLEAIYWAQKFPDEVKAIIGIDPSVPDFIEHSLDLPQSGQLSMMYVISRIGLSRFMPQEEKEKNFPLLSSNDLSDEYKEQYLAMFYKSAYTKNMLNEVEYLQNNAQKVSENKFPSDTPMYFFISDGKEVTEADWRGLVTDYVSKVSMGRYMYLNSGHYLHHAESEIIAEEIKKFIREI